MYVKNISTLGDLTEKCFNQILECKLTPSVECNAVKNLISLIFIIKHQNCCHKKTKMRNKKKKEQS